MPRILVLPKFSYVGQGGGALKFGGGVTDLSPPTTESLQLPNKIRENRSDGYSKLGIENCAM
jgi:hypothetical protein